MKIFQRVKELWSGTKLKLKTTRADNSKLGMGELSSLFTTYRRLGMLNISVRLNVNFQMVKELNIN